MNSKTKYKTKQRDVLLNFLENAKGSHVTAGDVCEYCKKQGSSIGQATVYRQLEAMVDEGIVNKYIIDGNTPACFEYVGEEVHSDGEMCFHCKCEKCGKLIHMHCDELVMIRQHLLEHHDFLINPMRTVFYGLCDECREV
ncbi:MAG: transcriptional repressor [Lachnospiraceae bacterium]|nr:transcriptional repressor [Lachnospiraceae bacterium]